MVALGTGGIGAYNSTDVENKFQNWLDKQDETLQREMRLLTNPLDIRTSRLEDKMENILDRLNELERESATLLERTRP